MKITATESGKDCMMTEMRVAEVFSLVAGMPGRKKWEERTLIFQPTGANIAYVLKHWPEAVWEGTAEVIRDKWISIKQQEDNTRAEKMEKLTDSSGYEFRTKPYDHQRQAFLLQRDRETFALFHEQGTGKTKTILDTAAYLYEKGEIDTLIVLAKNGVHINWVVEEIPTHLPERIPHMAAYYTSDLSKSERKSLLEAPLMAKGMLRILTFHIEGMNAEGAREMLMAWLTDSNALVVIDESSRIKNHSAQRTKFLVKVCKKAPYRRIMTGTPLTSGIENLYSQFMFLDPKILGYESFYTFRNAYCIMGGWEGKQVTGYKNIEELIKTIDGHSHRVLKKDCLDLPPKVYRRLRFDMGKEQRKLYDVYRRQALEELQQSVWGGGRNEEGTGDCCCASFALQQIACGWTPDSEMRPLEGPNVRMQTLMEELEEAGDNKLIIWSRFKTDCREILRLLGKKAVPYYGDTQNRDRIRSVHSFKNDHNAQYFVASSAAAYGLSLPAAGAIYYSQSSSLDIRLQSEDRCHGIKRTTGPVVTYTDMEAIRSVDGRIITALKKHKSLADQINQDPTSIFMEEEE
jgi:SNF2 family DNA or RNA helicase